MTIRIQDTDTPASRLMFLGGGRAFIRLTIIVILAASLAQAQMEVPRANVEAEGSADMMNDNEVALIPDWGGSPFPSCGDLLTVAIELAPGPDVITGGQFHIEYDTTRLDFVSVDAGEPPFTNVLMSIVDEQNGLIDYAVGIPVPGQGTSDGATMGLITFEAIAQGDTFVRFRSHWPPTLLVDDLGLEITPILHDMDPLYINCQSAPPLPEDSLGVSCAEDEECLGEAWCIWGVCYAPKHRYISIRLNPAQVPYTARRVRLEGGAVLGWVGAPYDSFGLTVAEVALSPVYADRDFAGEWPDLVHVMGCEIATGQTYLVQAIQMGQDVGDEGNYSPPLALHTPSVWGDTVSNCAAYVCKPPNGVVNLDDVLAPIMKFQGIDNAPLTWLDIAPSHGDATPDQVVNVGDVLACLLGFQDEPYPGDGPSGCP